MSTNSEIKPQQSCIQSTLRINADLRRKFGIFARSVRVKLLYAVAVPRTASPALRRYSPSSGLQIVILGIKGGVRNVSQSCFTTRQLITADGGRLVFCYFSFKSRHIISHGRIVWRPAVFRNHRVTSVFGVGCRLSKDLLYTVYPN